MMSSNKLLWILPVYLSVFIGLIAMTMAGSRVVTVMSEQSPPIFEHTYIIDAGHGGEDGGAISCTGVFESHINLEISLKLKDIMSLLGAKCVLVRDTDVSIYTGGTTLALKKLSDLKERVKLVNNTPGGILVSIHQNYYSDSRCFGPQIFYANDSYSKTLAAELQNALNSTIIPSANRKAKPVEGIYLMKHIVRPGILVECGFISNCEEEAKLRDSSYQKKLCCVIASVLVNGKK